MENKKQFELMPKKGQLIRVKFRKGKDKVIGQIGRKICLITQINDDIEPPKPKELWTCRVIESFPNVIDVMPIEKYPVRKKQPEKTEELIPKKRRRTVTQKIIIEKV